MKPGVLVISHGSREAEWVRLVDDAVAQAARMSGGHGEAALPSAWDEGQPVPTVSAFLEIVRGRLIQDGIDRLEAEGVTELYVLPLFVSSGSTHVDDIAQAFGLPPVAADRPGELAPFRLGPGTRVRFGQPIDDGDDIAALLLANLAELSAEPRRERLLLVAHGASEPAFRERWLAGMGRLAERLCLLGGFAGADIATLLPDEAAAKLAALQEGHPGEAVLVAPLFLSSGYFTRTVIPRRLAGLDYRYNGRALLPHPAVARWMARQIGAWLAEPAGRSE